MKNPSLSLHIIPPIVHILESQHLPYLPITQRRLILAHLARHFGFGIILRQELLRWLLHSDGVVRRIENLEAEPALLDREVTDLAQVARVDV